MLEFEHVSKVYGNGTCALDDVSLKIEEGEFAFIVGPSGAGKSTLIKLLMKEEDPTEGKIIVAGQDLSSLRHRDVPYLRRKMGVVFQDFRLINELNVFDNVAFAMNVTNSSKRSIERRVPYVLSLMNLADKAKAFPSELSGGEQQRVALARALVNNPMLIVADEPTGNIDPHMSWEIMGLLNEINMRKTTVLVVTHEKNLVNAMKKRVIYLEKGRVRSDRMEGQYSER
ncbi:MAG: cell division ATP-binding protein FtsE [Clostridia bacterium]|nr:cell division ATP-binding protein FtsE [Clostridia bacterium]MBQ6058882.1 cell division ATP-binding protein FtsE [Clostridia bacterium]